MVSVNLIDLTDNCLFVLDDMDYFLENFLNLPAVGLPTVDFSAVDSWVYLQQISLLIYQTSIFSSHICLP